jgi:hypothetical protein
MARNPKACKKTKIMIFENGRKTDACFCYDQTMLDVVDSFNYLGITLFKNGGWYRTQKCLRDRGMYMLSTSCLTYCTTSFYQ